MQDLFELSELRAFKRVVDEKSLTRAARELSVPRATIGRRLARLEERLGARLLRRTTRSLVLTDAGAAFYRHATIVLDAAEQAQQCVRVDSETLRGSLRVSLPPIVDSTLNQAICEFAAAHPDVDLQLHFSTQMVDLRRDGYDVAIRASAELEPGLVARVLRRSTLVAVASPSYLQKMGVPSSIRDLRRHRCLRGFERGALPQSHWPRKGAGKVHVEGMLSSNDIHFLRDAARWGLGIALMPAMLVQDELGDGSLVQVLRGLIEAESRIAIVYPEREFLPPHVRAFVEAIIAWDKGRRFSSSAQESRPLAPRAAKGGARARSKAKNR